MDKGMQELIDENSILFQENKKLQKDNKHKDKLIMVHVVAWWVVTVLLIFGFSWILWVMK